MERSERIEMMADKVQRVRDLKEGFTWEKVATREDVAELYADRIENRSLHASLIDLIDKTQSCTSGLSFGECLEEIKRRLAAAKGSTDTEGR